MKSIGIKEYLIRKHVKILISDTDNLNFDENNKLHQGIKKAVQSSPDGSLTIYLRAT